MEKQNIDNSNNDVENNFSDFEDDFAIAQEDIERLRQEAANEISGFYNEDTPKELQEDKTEETGEAKEEPSSENEEDKQSEEDTARWFEVDKNKGVVKKYIFSIQKDLIPLMDSMTQKDKNAYINAAIRAKVDETDKIKQRILKLKMFIHVAIIVLIFIFLTPVMIYATNQAFLLTFKNYKYSQDNFEKLYRERFLKDKAYMRSVDFNKKQSAKSIK